MTPPMNEMGRWIAAQNEECFDATHPEVALLLGMSFDHVLAAAAGRTVVAVDDAAPVSTVAATVAPRRA